MATPTSARQIVVASLIFVAIITGFFTMISAVIPSDAGNFTNYNNSFNKFGEMREEMDDIADKTQNAKPEEGEEGILTGLYEASFGAVKKSWDSISILTTIISDLTKGALPFNMPTWFTALLITIISVTLAFALIASWRKWYT